MWAIALVILLIIFIGEPILRFFAKLSVQPKIEYRNSIGKPYGKYNIEYQQELTQKWISVAKEEWNYIPESNSPELLYEAIIALHYKYEIPLRDETEEERTQNKEGIIFEAKHITNIDERKNMYVRIMANRHAQGCYNAFLTNAIVKDLSVWGYKIADNSMIASIKRSRRTNQEIDQNKKPWLKK